MAGLDRMDEDDMLGLNELNEMNEICAGLAAASLEEPIHARLFKFLFSKEPNIAITSKADMSEIRLNSKYFPIFQMAIQEFNVICKTHKVMYINHFKQHEAYYNYLIQVYILQL
jgi:hypothetical protein